MSRAIRAVEIRQLDRVQWAGPVSMIFGYQTQGSGTFLTEEIEFVTAFEGAPFFSYGVELVEGDSLIGGDFPFVTVGVAEWVTQEITEEDSIEKKIKPFYLGAKLWISVSSSKAYELAYSLVFEGIVMKNPQFYGGTNG